MMWCTMSVQWLFFTFGLLCVRDFSAAQVENDIPQEEAPHVGRLVFNIEHSFGDGEYKPRGQVTVLNLRNKVGAISPSIPLTTEEQRQLKELAERKGIYRVRVPTPGKNGAYVSTIAPACGLLEAGMKDLLIFTFDNSGNLLNIADLVLVGSCTGNYNWLTPQDYSFNTTLEIKTVEPGPIPETAAYVQKIEQDKLAKERGDGKDNRSFLAKYWVYIVIAFLFVMMSGANNPEQGSGGGDG